LPAPAKTGEPFLEIKEERIVLLLAVVADVHAGFRLARHDCPHRRKTGRRNRVGIDASARARRTKRPVKSSGRGKLPACVVRIRSELRRMNGPALWRWPAARIHHALRVPTRPATSDDPSLHKMRARPRRRHLDWPTCAMGR